MTTHIRFHPHTERTRWTAALQSHGLKATAQRLLIAERLFRVPVHITAEQLLVQLRADGERVSKATVYNTLNAFAACGLLRALHVDPTCCIYDSTETPHHHFFDPASGELSDTPPGSVEFSRLPGTPAGMEVDAVEVVIRLRRRGAA